MNRSTLRLYGLRMAGSIYRAVQPATPRVQPSEPRILLIRPDHVGDLLFATPALRLLRKAMPHAHLTAMVGPWGEAVLSGNADLDSLIVCPFPGFSRQPKRSAVEPYRLLFHWSRVLRKERFDMAIVLRFDHWWGAWLAHAAGIPHRLGHEVAVCQPFLTRMSPYATEQHEVEQNLSLAQMAVAQLGPAVPQIDYRLAFAVSDRDTEDVRPLLARCRMDARRDAVIIHPGAGARVKLWPPECFASVADLLAERHDAQILITGSMSELDLAWSVSARMRQRACVVAGDTTLGQLAALFQRARLVIGPDCGPLHLATAVGTPTVHLYGPASVRKFGPWPRNDKHIAIMSGRTCVPCNRLDYREDELSEHPCMQDIEPETVVAAAERILASPSPDDSGPLSLHQQTPTHHRR